MHTLIRLLRVDGYGAAAVNTRNREDNAADAAALADFILID